MVSAILEFSNYNWAVWHEISNNVVHVTIKPSDQPAHMCSLIRAFASRLNIRLEYLSWKDSAQAGLSLHLLRCHIVGNHMSRLKYCHFGAYSTC